MTTLRNNGGPHVLANGVNVAHGATFEIDGTAADILKAFPNKFVVVPTPVVVAPPPPAAPPEIPHVAPVVATPATAPGKAPAKPSGKQPSKTAPAKEPVKQAVVDVTEKFPDAVEADLKVYQDEGGLWIYDGAETINKVGIANEAEVSAQIKKYLV